MSSPKFPRVTLFRAIVIARLLLLRNSASANIVYSRVKSGIVLEYVFFIEIICCYWSGI
jgi:hypothetical protein